MSQSNPNKIFKPQIFTFTILPFAVVAYITCEAVAPSCSAGLLVLDSDDEDGQSVAHTSLDHDSCAADPTWTDAQPPLTCSPAPSLPTSPSLASSSPKSVMTAVKAQPARPSAEASELNVMKEQYVKLQAQMAAMKELMEKQGLQASPPTTPLPKHQAFSPVPAKAVATPTPPQLPPKASAPGCKAVPKSVLQEKPLTEKLQVPLPPVAVPQTVVRNAAANPVAVFPTNVAAASSTVAAPVAEGGRSTPNEPDVGQLAPGEERLAETFDLSAEDSLVGFF